MTFDIYASTYEQINLPNQKTFIKNPPIVQGGGGDYLLFVQATKTENQSLH